MIRETSIDETFVISETIDYIYRVEFKLAADLFVENSQLRRLFSGENITPFPNGRKDALPSTTTQVWHYGNSQSSLIYSQPGRELRRRGTRYEDVQ